MSVLHLQIPPRDPSRQKPEPERRPSFPFRLRQVGNERAGLLDTGSARAVCFENPELPGAWRLYVCGADGRWRADGPWLWHEDAQGEAEEGAA